MVVQSSPNRAQAIAVNQICPLKSELLVYGEQFSPATTLNCMQRWAYFILVKLKSPSASPELSREWD